MVMNREIQLGDRGKVEFYFTRRRNYKRRQGDSSRKVYTLRVGARYPYRVPRENKRQPANGYVQRLALTLKQLFNAHLLVLWRS